jgi:hypothetical protein
MNKLQSLKILKMRSTTGWEKANWAGDNRVRQDTAAKLSLMLARAEAGCQKARLRELRKVLELTDTRQNL